MLEIGSVEQILRVLELVRQNTRLGFDIGAGTTNPRLLRKIASNSEMLCRGLGSAARTARYQNSIWKSSGRLRINST